jgi:hypothetical protein
MDGILRVQSTRELTKSKKSEQEKCMKRVANESVQAHVQLVDSTSPFTHPGCHSESVRIILSLPSLGTRPNILFLSVSLLNVCEWCANRHACPFLRPLGDVNRVENRTREWFTGILARM